jgi:hypothetical protein
MHRVSQVNSQTKHGSFKIENSIFQIYHSIDEISDQWDQIPHQDLYYSSSFLKLVEVSKSLMIKPIYVLEFENQELVNGFYFQIKKFVLSESIKPGNFIKNLLARAIKFEAMIHGNVLLTGRYGIVSENASEINKLEKIFHKLHHHTNNILGIKTGAILSKDYLSKDIIGSPTNWLTKFEVHPNMVFHIDSDWINMENYSEALKTKYRTRYNRARKKLNPITSRIIDSEELVTYQQSMYELYLNISLNAPFNLFTLPETYFLDIKHIFKDDLVIKAYFLEDKMVGFSTVLVNQNHLDAHFLGYDTEINHQHQLYLNMLYDMIELGISIRSNFISMSRTAIEIKSSVGAVPQDMHCYFRYNQNLIHRSFQPIFNAFKPQSTFVMRYPFKNGPIEEEPQEIKVKDKSCHFFKF